MIVSQKGQYIGIVNDGTMKEFLKYITKLQIDDKQTPEIINTIFEATKGMRMFRKYGIKAVEQEDYKPEPDYNIPDGFYKWEQEAIDWIEESRGDFYTQNILESIRDKEEIITELQKKNNNFLN